MTHLNECESGFYCLYGSFINQVSVLTENNGRKFVRVQIMNAIWSRLNMLRPCVPKIKSCVGQMGQAKNQQNGTYDDLHFVSALKIGGLRLLNQTVG